MDFVSVYIMLTWFSLHTAGGDYVDRAQSLLIPADSINGSYFCVSIPIINDNIAETNQSFYVILTSLTPGVFTVADDGGKATVTIVDDEG